MTQIHFTSAPDGDEVYKVGDRVEVMCDHVIDDERIRDWLLGTVVQVDPKLIAVQFKEDVYLTDGWMVPDHVLWYPKLSKKVRHYRRRRRTKTRE